MANSVVDDWSFLAMLHGGLLTFISNFQLNTDFIFLSILCFDNFTSVRDFVPVSCTNEIQV